MVRLYDVKKGLENLKRHIQIAPDTPGVYRMISEYDEVLYVGKAKNIKKRIVAYSHIDKLPVRLQQMVAQIARMEFIILENEARALLVENELIKKFKPRYNILLKDDKTFPHLMIDMQTKYPCLRKYRGQRHDKNKYFGPFASVGAVNSVIDVLQKAFLLRSCSDAVFHNRQRPCLQYQIKRCSAPCVAKISVESYRQLVKDAVDFLEGKNSKIQDELSEAMNEASAREDYETAIILRDRIRALTAVQARHNVEYAGIKSADVIALARDKNFVCIQIFFIRGGQNCGNAPFFPTQVEDASDSEVLEAFISSFYTGHVPPKEIIVDVELENADFLSEAVKAKIICVCKGNKAKLVDMARENAIASIARKVALMAGVKDNLQAFKERFGLPTMPQRIEIYDNSHIQGSFAIGAMVVATPEGFDRKNYRTFNIKNADITNDDFAMMKEVLLRRFKRMSSENRPDVILLDGGRGQLNAVYEALDGFDLSGITIVAISKGPERNAGKEFYHMVGKESFALEFQSPLAFYLQNLRDEAHRFAIGTHRKKRGKSIFKSSLDEVEGIGAKRKRDLLNYFGSADEVAQASVKDLQKVVGISKKTAEKIFNYFHN
ncbi:MAG: excinuclease ABC subunit UvrC [Alphaproteobacteria bacterium]|nr:excinuclease ABC subunit UvrC [Alphaproteobacteria bacterium]